MCRDEGQHSRALGQGEKLGSCEFNSADTFNPKTTFKNR